MQYAIVALLVLAGVGLTFQDALNALLRAAVKSPMLGGMVSYGVGTAALVLLFALGVLGRGKGSDLAHTPWWQIAGGGLLGAFAVVIMLIGIPKVSAGAVIAATVFGQLTAAVVVDHFGWLGVPRVPVSGWRVGGAVLLLAGALLMQRK